jgi:hypothetical protein
LGQGFDAHDLGGQIVLAAARIGFLGKASGRRVEIVPGFPEGLDDERCGSEFVDAVGRQDEQVAFFDL